MTCPIPPLTDNAKFAFTGEHWGEHGWSVTSSGKGVEISGIMWPISQLRIGAETQYGHEIFAAKWLLRQRGIEADAKRTDAFNALATMKAENRRQGY
jgi:hypothetical protein